MGILSNAKMLSHGARKFVQLQVMFSGMGAILTLFINTYLLNAYGSFSKEVILYNLVMAVANPIAMVAAMKLTDRRNALFVQQMGFVFYGTALIVLCFFGEEVSAFYPLFALMLGGGSGFYYATYSAQMLCYTQDGNRDLIGGLLSLLGSLISVFLPLLSGLLISRLGAHTGYRIVFGIAAALAIVMIITIRKLPQLPKHKKEPALRKVCKTLMQSEEGRLIMIANGLLNCRNFTLPIFITLLFYNMAPDEFLISLNSTLGYIVALLGAGLYGSVVQQKNRVKYSALATLVVMLPCVAMFFKLNVAIIIVFSAFNGFFSQFISTPVLNTHFKVVEKLNLHGEYGAEVHFVRELFVVAGRALGLVLVWIVPKTTVGAVFVLTTLMLTTVVNAFILRKIR